MMFTDPDRLVGLTVLGVGGEDLGTVDAVLADDASGRLEWVVMTRADERTAPVPLAGAELDGAALAVRVDAHAVRTAPATTRSELDPREREHLLAHYGLPAGNPVDEPTGRHPAGRHSGREDDRAERDQVAAGADGGVSEPDEDVPGVRH